MKAIDAGYRLDKKHSFPPAAGRAYAAPMLKTITFTTMHITIAFTVVYLMTGSVMVGGAVALVEPLCNSVGYFLHERIWERLRSRRGAQSGLHALATAS
jgi:uncharacterized membrane protein